MIGTAALGALLPGCRPRSTGLPRASLPRPGMQLYTVREAMEADLPGTLRRISELGYREVEFAGYFGHEPTSLGAILEDLNLSAPASHLPLEALEGNFEATLEIARILGHRWMVVAWVPEEQRRTLDDWREVARRFNTIGQRARSAGLRFAYHNHAYEFVTVDGETPFDLLLEETDPDWVDFELDVYWAVNGGQDPLAILDRWPDRFPLLHLKDSAGPPDHRQVKLGTGVIDFPAILAAEGEALQHTFLEHDDPADPWEFARAGIEWYRSIDS
ncbi:MAG: sugar phosphate isomerase/epimerase family protein [Gemmatimonadales bacterium]